MKLVRRGGFYYIEEKHAPEIGYWLSIQIYNLEDAEKLRRNAGIWWPIVNVVQYDNDETYCRLALREKFWMLLQNEMSEEEVTEDDVFYTDYPDFKNRGNWDERMSKVRGDGTP